MPERYGDSIYSILFTVNPLMYILAVVDHTGLPVKSTVSRTSVWHYKLLSSVRQRKYKPILPVALIAQWHIFNWVIMKDSEVR